MPLPAREEINVYDSLDERRACEHFFGKSLDEAEQLFRENSLGYQEDLMWMGPVGFRYYVQAAIKYIESDAATGDSDIISCFAGLLEFRLEHEPQELIPVARPLASISGYIVERYDWFDVDPDLYGDVRGRFETLHHTFLRLVPTLEPGK